MRPHRTMKRGAGGAAVMYGALQFPQETSEDSNIELVTSCPDEL